MRKKILLKAPILTRSGYGEQSRFALRALMTREDIFDIYIQPLQWGKTSWIALQDEERHWIDKTIEKIVVSDHAKQSYENTQVEAVNNQTGEKIDYSLKVPVEVVGYPTKKYDNLPETKLDIETEFNFLCIAQMGPRKNLNNTLKWFVEEFHDDAVGLIIKANIMRNCLMDRERTNGVISNMLSKYPDRKCKVYLIHGDMSDEEIHSLYVNKKASAFLALPHGEGFGLPIFEAAYSGLPVITVGWSGQIDYLADSDGEHFYNVSYDIQQVQPEVVWENVLIAESMWAFAREQSAKEKMRQCYSDITNNSDNTIASKACEYATVLHNRFSPERMYDKFISCIYDEPEEIDFQNWSEEQQGAQEID